MILVDTSVWVHHLRFGDAQLAALLDVNSVVMHPYIVGEIACGSLSKRVPTLELLQQLPMTPVAESDECWATSKTTNCMARASGMSMCTYLRQRRLAAQDSGRATDDSTLWLSDWDMHTRIPTRTDPESCTRRASGRYRSRAVAQMTSLSRS